MITINQFMRVTAIIAVTCMHCLAQGSVTQGGNGDNPVTIRDVRPAPERVVIPLHGYSQSNRHTNGMMTTLAGGIYEVGDDQPDLKKLTHVATQLNGATLTGNVIYELNASYNGTTGETFPIVFNQFSSLGGTWSVTIRIKNGVGPRSTTGNTANPLLVFDGADNLILDGRAGGTGSAISWNLYNANANGTVALFINDAQSNTISYCDLVSLHKSLGVVTFGSTTGAQGNDNNTIAWCNIHDNGIDSPGYGIYSSGKKTDVNAYNSGISVENCNIYNMFNDGVWCESILLEYGSTAWNISGNSFYQTITRNPAGAITNFDMIDILIGDGYTITGNYIGGSAPQCGGSPWTIDGLTTTKTFYGIVFNGQIGDNPNTIDGNTITNLNIDFNVTSTNYLNLVVFAGILIGDGIHNITNNVVGSATGTNKIYIQSGPSISGNINGLFYQMGQGGDIKNNVFGGFTFDAYPDVLFGSASPLDVYMVRLNSVTNTVPLDVSNNIMGSLTTPNSVMVTALPGAPGYIRVNGLYISTSTGQASMTVTNNTAANINANSTSSSSYVRGLIAISYYNGAVISGNVARDLTTNAANASTNLGSCALLGHQILMSAPGTVAQNSAYDLYCTHTSAATIMVGLFIQGPTVGTEILERNFIHNLSNLSSSASAHIYGINIASGNSVLKNNMISLGIKPDGSPIATGIQLTGIMDVNGTNSYYNNSVYIGGSVASGVTGNTNCFNSTATTSARNVLNNIFFNARSGGTTGKHYAIRFSGINPVFVKSDYNLLLASGVVGGTLGYYNTNITTLNAWKVATGVDMSSGSGNPGWINPSGSTANVNLHLQSPSPAEGGGVSLPDVMTDYDGEARSSLSPADIGADAGNYTSSGDIFGPSVSYPLLPNSTTANRVLTDFATISDNVAVAGGTDRPRFYFKRSTDANAFVGNTAADNGWKYVMATNSTSPYSFVVDYSLLFGGSVASGTTIQYFVVAQDGSNNMNSQPMLATAGTNPPIENITAAPAVVNQYMVSNVMISGTINVPGSYPTLTGTGGLFEALNNSLVNGNVVVNITGNLTEPGAFGLNQFSQVPENATFSLLIKPDAAVERLISGSVADGMIRINGADRITVDGNYNGSGRFLKFVNSNTANPTFILQNGSNFITLKNLTIEGANTTATSGVILIGGSNATVSNNDLVFNGNVIRNLSSGTGIPNSLIYSAGTTLRENYNVTISNNDLFNFRGYGINVTSSANGNNWTVTGNNFYCTLVPAPTTAQTPINLVPGVTSSGNTISNNFVGGSAPGCGGTPWVNASTGFTGISLTMGSDQVNTIENNLVRNISLTNTGSCTFTGINASGWISCNANTVGGTTGTPSIAKTGAGTFAGINLSCAADKTNEIHNNTVGEMYCSGTGYFSTTGIGIYGKVNCTHNTVGNPNVAVSIYTNASPPSYAPTGTTATGISANVSGYFGFNKVAGVIQGNTNPGTFWGLYFPNTLPKVVEANQVLNSGPGSASMTTTDVIGINASLSVTAPAVYKNNVVSLGEGISNNNSYKGIIDAGSAGNAEFYNNSIRLGGSSTGTSNSYAYYKSGAGSSTQMNNIYADFRTGPGIQYATGVTATAGPLVSDYNDFYSLETPVLAWGTNNYANLSDWQAATSKDMHSVSADPLYHSVVDLQPCGAELEDAGIAVDGVETDYTGATRSDPPDIGAFEFTLPVASITTGTPDDFCNGEWLTAHSTKSPATYLWSTASTNQSIFLNLAGSEPGSYTVYVTDEDGCRSASAAEYNYVPEDLASSYTLLGFHEAQLGENNTVLNGSMGLTGEGMTAYVKKNAMVNGPGAFVKASFIDAHPTAVIRSKIYGPVTVDLPSMQYNTTSGVFTNMTVGNNTTITIPNNYINLTVGQNSNVTLTGSIFGNIQAGKGSTITFVGNSIDIDNLKSMPGSALSPVTFAFSQDANVRVKTKVDMDVYTIVNPGMHKVIFYIGQQTGNPGMLLVKATGAVFNGSAYVPAGQIHVITDGLKTAPALMNGKFIADKILGTGKYVTWNWYNCEGGNAIPDIVLEEPDAFSNSAEAVNLQIRPVPNDGLFTIRITAQEEETFTLRIFNAMGTVVREIKGVAVNGTLERTVDLRPAAPGFYSLVIINDHTKITRKIVVD